MKQLDHVELEQKIAEVGLDDILELVKWPTDRPIESITLVSSGRRQIIMLQKHERLIVTVGVVSRVVQSQVRVD